MKTVSEYRTVLESLKAEILADLKIVATQQEATGDWEAAVDAMEQSETDENSEADAAEELATRTAVVTELEIMYRNIERALEKISNNTFGVCEICAAPIEQTRLAILPSARTCLQHRDEERTLPL